MNPPRLNWSKKKGKQGGPIAGHALHVGLNVAPIGEINLETCPVFRKQIELGDIPPCAKFMFHNGVCDTH